MPLLLAILPEGAIIRPSDTAANRPDKSRISGVNSAVVSLDFPEGTSAKAVWRLLIPPQIEMGTLSSDDLVIRLRYTAKTANSGNVGWEVAAYLLDIGDPAGDDTGATVTDSNNTSNLAYSGAAYDEQENTVTIAGFFTGIDTSKAYTLILKITRRTVSGDLAGEVSLLPSYAVLETSNGSTYTRPSWPAIEADEEFRAALATADSASFDDVSGKANHGAVSGIRPSLSHFYGKIAMASTGGYCRVQGYASLRRAREWTVDMVFQQHGNILSTACIFYLSNIAGGNLKGGLQLISPNQWQIWTPAGWVNLPIFPIFYTYNIHSVPRVAMTMQWDSSDVLHLWLNGWKAYTSATLTPPTVVGDEGIYIPNGPSIEFIRYRAAAPADPHSWQSAALYGS